MRDNHLDQAEREFSRVLQEVCDKHPKLRDEICRAFVRDTREALVMEQIVNAEQENQP